MSAVRPQHSCMSGSRLIATPSNDLSVALPVKQHVEYKLCTTVHSCLYGNAPSYFTDLITPSAAASARAGLRSAESMTIAVPCTLSSFGDRSFAAAGPCAWNKLPSHLRVTLLDVILKHFYLTKPFYHDTVRHRYCAPALTSR